jgi:hypothetical protein
MSLKAVLNALKRCKGFILVNTKTSVSRMRSLVDSCPYGFTTNKTIAFMPQLHSVWNVTCYFSEINHTNIHFPPDIPGVYMHLLFLSARSTCLIHYIIYITYILIVKLQMPAERIASGVFRFAIFPRISPYLGSRFAIGHARCLCLDHQLFFGLNLYLTENTVCLCCFFFKLSSFFGFRSYPTENMVRPYYKVQSH